MRKLRTVVKKLVVYVILTAIIFGAMRVFNYDLIDVTCGGKAITPSDVPTVFPDTWAISMTKDSLNPLSLNAPNFKSVRSTNDGGYIVSGYTDSFTGSNLLKGFILKIDENGKVEWQKSIGTKNTLETFSSVVTTDDGGYIAAGQANSTDIGESGNRDGWIVKFSSHGDIEWQKTYHGKGDEEFEEIHQTYDGGYILAGHTHTSTLQSDWTDGWIVKTDRNGEIEWEKTLGNGHTETLFSIYPTSDRGFIAAGNAFSPETETRDGWVVKLSIKGNVEWSKTFGGESKFDQLRSIKETNDGTYVVAGNTRSYGNGNRDGWLIKLSATGNLVWQRTYGGELNDVFNSIDVNADGGYIAIGSSNTFNSDDSDAFVAKIASNGTLQWQRIFGTGCSENFNSVVRTSDRGYVAVGSSGNYGFILKFNNQGVIPELDSLYRSETVEMSSRPQVNDLEVETLNFATKVVESTLPEVSVDKSNEVVTFYPPE